MKRIFVLALLSLGASLCVCAQRLPDTVVPSTYDLTFTPDLVKATFSGEETIHVSVVRPTSAIVLNSAELEIQDANVSVAGATEKATVSFDVPKEQATLTLPKELPAGPAEIHINFTGILNDKLRGFYLSKSERRNYAVTQFEATDARRAFPSFDEPAFKSVFNITLIIDKADTAISNGKIISDTPGPGDNKHTLKFAPSAKISSYLVAMLVGDFVCREGGADGIPIRVCSLPEQKEMTAFALEASENILKFYNKYYSIKYPYGKLDHIVFPDFAAGAMENAGAITYRDSFMLVNDKTSSYDFKQNVASGIAHEMAHQWFGDLVTMQWWNDIWLNEGFATWMAWKPLEAWKPEWNLGQQEIAETLGALGSDSIPSVRTIRANAESPADIQALFDGIAYGKAGAVLRMVEAYVGPETFQKGINAYLEKHKFANATAEDFWNQIAETSGKPVDRIMKSFTEQPGAPLVSVKTECKGDKTEVTLSQERYVSDAAVMAAGSKEIWPIPVSLLPSATKKPEYHLLTQKQETIELPGCSAWVYANAGGRGYYRSSYDPASFAKLSADVEKSLSAEERVRVPSDAWALVRVGKLNIGDYLNLLQQMQSERSREVLQVMIGHIPQIHDTFVAEKDRLAFEKWTRDFLAPIAKDLGETPVAGEPAERQALRSDIFAMLAQYGRDPQLIAKARATAEQYMKDPQSVDAELAGKALVISAMNGDAALYDQYVAHMKTAKNPEEYGSYLQSLGMFPQPELAKRTFEIVLGPDV
ncbi:MAG TPA: M1 family metallopeptidase, partial [Candidatus Acidoferrum sp.]|nr:M1 family metallopeptidase [Candidatus Acidoferrum sp.]